MQFNGGGRSGTREAAAKARRGLRTAAVYGSQAAACHAARSGGPEWPSDMMRAMQTAFRNLRRAVVCMAALLPPGAARPTPSAMAADPSSTPSIAPREQPIRFKLVREWQAGDVTMPGNIVCLDDDEARSVAEGAEPEVAIVVLDGGRAAVILDAAGRERARHTLRIPGDRAVDYLRTAIDSRHKRWWLAAARGSPQVFLFDDEWTLRTSYPSLDGADDAPIGGATLADCDGDGSPEIIVGFAGTGGLEAASLDGRRLWRAPSPAAVHDVTLDAPRPGGGRGLVCLDADGRLTPIDAEGIAGEARLVGPRRIRRLFGGPVAPDGAWAIVGLAADEAGEPEAVGIGPGLDPGWSLQLDRGPRHAAPVEAVAWANLLGTQRRQWLIAAADGSVTIAWADGGVVGRYRHGAPLVGIGGYRDRDGGHVVLATPDAVESLLIDDVALD